MDNWCFQINREVFHSFNKDVEELGFSDFGMGKYFTNSKIYF